jgi:hypothetical protein
MTAVIRNNRANHWQWPDGRKRAFDTRQNPQRLAPYGFSRLHDLARARRQVDTWTSSERGIALSNGQAEFYDKDEADRRFEAALRGARITGHKLKTDIPKKAAGIAGCKDARPIADYLSAVMRPAAARDGVWEPTE